jgi:nitrite reductase/ring-hydroxylating ferredoxin subunit
VTVQLAITGAVQDAAPEVTEVVVEGMTTAPPSEPKLLQIGTRPRDAGGETAQVTGAGAGWIALPNIGPPSSRPISASADGIAVLVCSVRGTLYAYRDACAACDSSLAEGQLDRELLTCPGCGAQYNVRLAGKSAADPALHLDPLPLLADSQGVRVAVPEVVR